jgi:hypothetical protein
MIRSKKLLAIDTNAKTDLSGFVVDPDKRVIPLMLAA